MELYFYANFAIILWCSRDCAVCNVYGDLTFKIPVHKEIYGARERILVWRMLEKENTSTSGSHKASKPDKKGKEKEWHCINRKGLVHAVWSSGANRNLTEKLKQNSTEN